MYRAFVNIIENATRYAESRITILCKYINGRKVVVIENDGEKISDDEIGLVFDRFYKGKGGKHGIGLSIVRSVVRNHGGEVSVENCDVGVRFVVEFED